MVAQAGLAASTTSLTVAAPICRGLYVKMSGGDSLLGMVCGARRGRNSVWGQPVVRVVESNFQSFQRNVSAVLRFLYICKSLPWLALGVILSANAELAVVPVAHQDFGVAQLSNAVQVTISWTNTTTQTVRFANASASCDCLELTGWPKNLGPNAVGTLSLTARPTESGPVHYAIFLESVDTRQLLMFTLSGEVLGEGAVTAAPAEKGLLISAVDLRRIESAPSHPLLVDVRPQARFVLGHLPGSLNLPLHDLRARSHLQRRPVVLIDEGDDSPVLLGEAQALMARGMTNLRVLDGGLRAWRQSGGGLDGVQTSSSRIFELEAADVAATQGDPSWLWVWVGEANGAPSGTGIPGIQALQPESLATSLQKFLRESPAVRNVLVLNQQGDGYDAIEAGLSGAQVMPWFYLSAGWNGFSEFPRQQAAARSRHVMTSGAPEPRMALRSGRSATRSGSCCGRK